MPRCSVTVRSANHLSPAPGPSGVAVLALQCQLQPKPLLRQVVIGPTDLPLGTSPTPLSNVTGPQEQLTLERRDSGDSSMWSSSELSISSSIPVIFPARFECIVWMSGNKRSPVGRTVVIATVSNPREHNVVSDPLGSSVLCGTLTQHLLLFLGGCRSQHGGSQRLLPLDMDCRLRCLRTR